jgi:hypothetical protein
LEAQESKGKVLPKQDRMPLGTSNPTAFSMDLASKGPTINYLRLTNVVVNPAVKPKIMKMYAKGLSKDEQTKDLLSIILKE